MNDQTKEKTRHGISELFIHRPITTTLVMVGIVLFGFAFLLMAVSPFIPYFTFGEDHLMVKELGYDTIMFVGAIFAVLAASMFVGDEIEGRTAITLMSKPVTRRQFLLDDDLRVPAQNHIHLVLPRIEVVEQALRIERAAGTSDGHEDSHLAGRIED